MKPSEQGKMPPEMEKKGLTGNETDLNKSETGADNGAEMIFKSSLAAN